MMFRFKFLRNILIISLNTFLLVTNSTAQQKATISIDFSRLGARVSPDLHGIFFEEISHAGEGGLYAELIRNRGFEDTRLPQGTTLIDSFIVPPRTPGFTIPDNGISDWKMRLPWKSPYPGWSIKTEKGAIITASITSDYPLNIATPHSMKLEVEETSDKGLVHLVNDGFWGINAIEGDDYYFSFYLRTNKGYNGNVMISLRTDDGTVLAARTFSHQNSRKWKKLECTLRPNKTFGRAKLFITLNQKGTVWVDFVSLFPAKTFKNRRNGLRKDLADYIDSLKPSFIRWPGGCFVEGINIQSAPDWKRTIGPVEQRPGTFSPWGYWTSDGLGYHEFLQFCEDIHANALFVFNGGISCEYRSGTFAPDDSLQFYIQNALDAIEYAIGPVTSKWGKARAANGHPAPYPLKYVEVGNEQHGPHYAERYNLFYDAIKKKYPQIEIMASMGIGDVNNATTDKMRKIDYVDEHAYKAAYWSMVNYDHFDKYKRGNWKMYVGEYATNAGVGAGNMIAALSDAVYIMAMERNSDLVKMSSYAPLLVNVNDVSWPVNLINFNANQSFARISYYVIKMMNENKPDVNLKTQTMLHSSLNKQPSFSGGIGLATWDTQTEYKDIEVIKDGKSIYKSDFINNAGEWKKVRGNWKVTDDGGFAQTAEGAQLLSFLDGKTFDTYTLKLKARKLSGYNAFIIPFAIKDSNTFLRVHIGSWWNQNVVYENVTNGYEVADLTKQKKLGIKIEPNKWYDIRIEVGTDYVKTYLEDTLLATFTEPQKFFAIAGKTDSTGDVIIKVVNASSEAVQADIQLSYISGIKKNGTEIVICSQYGTDENSLAHPYRYIPVTKEINGLSNEFEKTFPPLSLSIIRLKTK